MSVTYNLISGTVFDSHNKYHALIISESIMVSNDCRVCILQDSDIISDQWSTVFNRLNEFVLGSSQTKRLEINPPHKHTSLNVYSAKIREYYILDPQGKH